VTARAIATITAAAIKSGSTRRRKGADADDRLDGLLGRPSASGFR
jgi:hypothetical protein